jgi:hypothetical protein
MHPLSKNHNTYHHHKVHQQCSKESASSPKPVLLLHWKTTIKHTNLQTNKQHPNIKKKHKTSNFWHPHFLMMNNRSVFVIICPHPELGFQFPIHAYL